jgi:hypothetical protein
VVGDDSFSKMFVYARCIVMYYRAHSVIKLLILQFDKGAFYAHAYIIYIYSMCIIEHYICT